MKIPSKVHITGTPPRCLVKVNGEPLAVTSVDLHLDCDSVPQAVISLPVLDDIDIETEADIAVDERTRLALLRLGWTPPGETLTYSDCQHPSPGVDAVIIGECTGLAVYRDDEPPWKKDAERRKQARIDGTWQPS